jgi:hypothetical protein
MVGSAFHAEVKKGCLKSSFFQIDQIHPSGYVGSGWVKTIANFMKGFPFFRAIGLTFQDFIVNGIFVSQRTILAL